MQQRKKCIYISPLNIAFVETVLINIIVFLFFKRSHIDSEFDHFLYVKFP